MKRTFTLLCFLFCLSLYSQVSFAVKGSFTITDVSRDSYFPTYSKESFSIGAYGEIKFSKFAVNAEINYQKNGFTADQDQYRENDHSAPILIKGDYKINQVNLCLALKYYPIKRLSIRTGPYFGIITGFDVNGSIPGTSSNNNFNTKNPDKNDDFGLASGIEFYLFQGLFVDASYYYGLNNIGDTGNVPTKNRIISFGIGYKI